ncbi:MAG: DUF4317 domain-containing protein [Clostridium sp.]
MNKKDVLELKRRLKKDHCTFTRMCGCYVDAQKNIVLNLKETVLNLDENEFFKYLEIAKKTLSGTIGNNLLELNFVVDEENVSNKQHFLMNLKKSRLKDDSLLDDFYKSIIDSYDYTGNFIILAFHDAYDVITKTSDNSKLDESEEVYEYILCAICPVSLTKSGLGYLEDEDRIGALSREWMVGPPDLGFVFPAFIDRSSDVNSLMYYTKNAKDTHPELMEDGLGCDSKQTATEQKAIFHTIIQNAIGDDEETANKFFMEIQENLNNIVDEKDAMTDTEREPIILSNNVIQDVLLESGVPEEITTKIEKSYTEEFGDTPPVVEHLIDAKILAANAQRKKEQRLVKQVQILHEMLEKTKQDAALESEPNENIDKEEAAIMLETESTDEVVTNVEIESSETTVPTDSATELNSNTNIESVESTTQNYDIVLQVKPQKVAQIKSQIIDGKKYIVIPMDDNEQANVNGTDTLL